MMKFSYFEFVVGVFYYIKWSGYGAFTFDKKGFAIKRYDWFWFVLNLLIGIAAFVISVTLMNFQSTNKSVIIVYGNLLVINGAILISIYSLINCFSINRITYDATMLACAIDGKVST